MTELPATGFEHPTPQGMTFYFWECTLLLLARSLLLDRPTGPLAATLRIACGEPYTIEVGSKKLVTRASLAAPKAERRRIVAMNSDIALFYLPLEVPEYAGLGELLRSEPLIEIPFSQVERFVPSLRNAMQQVMPAAEVKALVREVVAAIGGAPRPVPPVDPRVEQVRQVLADMRLDDVSLEAVARRVSLSPSRLRDLFKRHTGFTIGEYARWRAVWRACALWERGYSLTRVAEEAGFHDLAHADRVFIQAFGMNPSAAIDPKFVTVVNCDEHA